MAGLDTVSKLFWNSGAKAVSLSRARMAANKTLMTMFKRAGAATAYGLAGGAAGIMIDKMQEQQRDYYGDSTSIEALGHAKGVVKAISFMEGAGALFGASSIERLIKTPGDIANLFRRSPRGSTVTAANKANLLEKYRNSKEFIGSASRLAGSAAIGSTIGAIVGLRAVSPMLGIGAAAAGAGFTSVAAFGLTATAGGISNALFGVKAMGVALGAGAVGAGVALNLAVPQVSEGNIINFSNRESATSRMNFSTAGLGLAIRNNSRRSY